MLTSNSLSQPVPRRGPASWAALLIGLAAPVRIDIVGILYLSEILLVAVGLWALVSTIPSKTFWRGPVATVCLLLAACLAGYVLSDLVWQTETPRLLRGWARIAFLASNFLGIYFLCWKRPANFRWYCIGSGVGSLLYLLLRGQLFSDWKLGSAVPLTLLVASLVSAAGPLRMQVAAGALGAVGVLHLLLDSRAIAGACVLASLALLGMYLTRVNRNCIGVAVLALAGMSVVTYTYLTDQQLHGQRWVQSSAWRSASFATAWNGITASPCIGNGSQAGAFRFQSEYEGRYAEASGKRYRGRATDTSRFTPHSQILQAWFEAGVAGVAFFIFAGWRCILAVKACVLERAAGSLTPLFLVFLIHTGWQLLFSPFAGPARLEVAGAAVIFCLLHT